MAGTATPGIEIGALETFTYTGTGAAIVLDFGFIPKAVLFFNVTDADQAWFWFTGMTAGTAISIGAATATVATEGVTGTLDGSAGTGQGLTLGTNAVINESAKVYRGIAFR